uniref:Formin like 3 n=1 Tax=Serinus canaria TaxID=9135 RepID=A0A8C9NM79_SERCA
AENIPSCDGGPAVPWVSVPLGGTVPMSLRVTPPLCPQSSMNLPPDKARLLRQYDNEKKWDLICDQERFQVKSPPHAYIQKLRSFLEPGVTRKKFRRRVQESTKVLRELEISLRTNHIGWVREFLNDENKGLDVLVNYLSFAQCAVMDGGTFRPSLPALGIPEPPSCLSSPRKHPLTTYFSAFLLPTWAPPAPALTPLIPQDLDLERFEELFKTKAQGPALDLVCAKSKAAQKVATKVTLLEANRAKNLAITLRKAGRSADEICRAIHTFDLATLPVDFVECLMRFLPTEAEAKALRQYERERKPLEELADEDRFMLQFSKVERLPQRMAIMAFLGNFAENIQMLTPQLNAIIAASASVKSSQKLKHMLEIILALGNYMNSSKRGAVYGFKLQSLDLLLDTKSTDRKMTLLHFIALTVREKYPELATFWQELHFVEKAAAVSLENVLLDVKELGRGMELLRRECGQHESAVLRGFLGGSEGQLERLQRDARTAEDAYNTVVRYFGESPKTTPPSVFFPVFVRFIHSYKDAEQENETRKKQEEVMREKLLAQEAKKQEKRNKWQQQELIAELRRRQAKDHRPMYEGKDGTIEDIITALKSVPFTARTAKRGSRFFCDPSHHDESSC